MIFGILISILNLTFTRYFYEIIDKKIGKHLKVTTHVSLRQMALDDQHH